MFFDRLVQTPGRVEAYFKDELVRVRVNSGSGWVDLALPDVHTESRPPVQVGLPVYRKKEAPQRPEPRYVAPEESA